MTLAQTKPCRAHVAEAGNTLLIVMLTIAVLATVAGNLMWSASARYHVTYQSASWQESLVAAEAGVDFAMAELRKRITADPANPAFGTPVAGPDFAWTARPPGATADYPDLGRAFPASNRPFAVSVHPGEGNSTMRARVYVDVPGYLQQDNFARSLLPGVDPFMCEQSDRVSFADDPTNLYWYRIRSLGIAGVSGPPRVSPDARDNWLRRFSFVSDWRTAKPLDAGGPQVSRLVEVVAKPQNSMRFAFMADRQHDSRDSAINFKYQGTPQNILIDSYDSRKGPYNPISNHDEKGTLATNGTVTGGSQTIIKGNSFTNGGTDIPAAPSTSVSGQRRDDFFQDLAPVTLESMRPDWTGVSNLGTLNGLVASLLTPVASADPARPTRLKVNAIDLKAGKILNVSAPINLLDIDAPSYIKIYVQGDINVSDGGAIQIANGVRAIIYFTGNANITGLGVINDSLNGSHLLFKGIQPPADPDGNRPLRSIYLSTILDFQGSIYAPNHDLTIAMQAAGPAILSGSSGPGLIPAGVINGDSRTAEGQINTARDQVNASTTKLNTALAVQSQAYLAWVRLPLPGNLLFYNQSTLTVQALQNSLAIDQKHLSDLTVNLQSQIDDHLRGYSGLYGSYAARTIEVQTKTHVHYDQALAQAGPVTHYEIVNWFEDNVSRDMVKW